MDGENNISNIYRVLCTKCEPYICEGAYCFLTDILLVIAILVLFNFYSVLWIGIVLSIMFFSIEYFLNIRVGCLCVIDIIQKQTVSFSGKIQSLDFEKSYSSRFGSIVDNLYINQIFKAKVIIKDDYENEQWCRFVMPLKINQELKQIIKSEKIDTMNFIISKHSRVLLKCDVKYLANVPYKERIKINNCINHINNLELYYRS